MLTVLEYNNAYIIHPRNDTNINDICFHQELIINRSTILVSLTFCNKSCQKTTTLAGRQPSQNKVFQKEVY